MIILLKRHHPFSNICKLRQLGTSCVSCLIQHISILIILLIPEKKQQQQHNSRVTILYAWIYRQFASVGAKLLRPAPFCANLRPSCAYQVVKSYNRKSECERENRRWWWWRLCCRSNESSQPASAVDTRFIAAIIRRSRILPGYPFPPARRSPLAARRLRSPGNRRCQGNRFSFPGIFFILSKRR